jgi:hypothetical protein
MGDIDKIGRAKLISRDGKSGLFGEVTSPYGFAGRDERFVFKVDGASLDNVFVKADWDAVYEREPISLPTRRLAIIHIAPYVPFVRNWYADSITAKDWLFAGGGIGSYTDAEILKIIDNLYDAGADPKYRVIFEGVDA